jgi:hypothetical protein
MAIAVSSGRNRQNHLLVPFARLDMNWIVVAPNSTLRKPQRHVRTLVCDPGNPVEANAERSQVYSCSSSINRLLCQFSALRNSPPPVTKDNP